MTAAARGNGPRVTATPAAVAEPALARNRAPPPCDSAALCYRGRVNGAVLTLLAAMVAALLLLGALGAVLRHRAREAIGFGGAGLGGTAAILALLSLVLGGHPASLALPFGLPGAPFQLLLDPLAGFFIFLVFATGTAAIIFAAEAAPADAPISLAGMPACLGGLALAVLAADGFTLGCGLALGGGAIWATGRAEAEARTGAWQLGAALLAAATVVAATALLAPPQAAPEFAAIRAASAENAPPVAVLLLALLGLGALAGLAPLHAWLVPVHRDAPPRTAALLSGAMEPVAVYALIRVLVDLAGAAPPLWWGVPLVLMGAGSVMAGGIAAMREPTLDTALAAGTVRQSGLMAIGLGIVLMARAADLSDLAALALAAVLLLAAVQAVCGTLVVLAAGAMRYGAGTRRLDRMGGLIHRMPVSTGGFLAGMFGLAALPPGAGFAGTWLLFQAALAAPRTGGFALPVLFVALAAVLGLGGALAAASLLRLVGVACLGRPRTPRAAVADEPPRPARLAMIALAVTAVVLGVAAAPVLHLLADPAIRSLLGTGLGPRAGPLGLSAGIASPGYAALPLTVLLGLAGGIVWRIRQRRAAGTRSGPAWNDGFAAAPPWLPFGDPVTQSAGEGFAPEAGDLPWPRLSRPRLAGVWHLASSARRAVARARGPAVMLAAFALTLVLILGLASP